MTMRPGHRHGWAAVTGVALLALVAGAALAGAPPRTSSPTGQKPLTAPATPAKTPAPAATSFFVSPGPLGLMAFIDPETGLLTGPIGDLVPPVDQQAANVLLEPVRTITGGWALDLKGTGLEHYVLQVDPLGRRRVVCVQDARRVPALLPAPPAPAGPTREER